MKSKIKTFADACKFLKRDPKALPEVSMLDKKHQEYIVNHYKLVVITEALNQEYLGKDYKPDYSNISEVKYFPWFEVKADKKRPAGFGFSRTYCGNWRTYTYVGSRLCFPTSELALYSAKQFEKLHVINQLFTSK